METVRVVGYRSLHEQLMHFVERYWETVKKDVKRIQGLL